MYLNKEELKDIIRDEILKYFSEDNQELLELGLCHKPSGKDGGQFTKCEKNSVYSLSKRAADDHNIDPDYIKRGVVSSKKPRQPPKVSAKFGINSSTKGKGGGRQKHPSGTRRSPERSISRYPERYQEGNERQHKTQRQLDIEKCRKIGFKTAQEIIDAYLRSVSKAQAAADGDYPKQQK